MVSETGEPDDLPHLHPAARRIARLPAAERLRHVRADRWIGYTRATDALDRLETLFSWPAKQRMPNLLLIGPTNNGKSMIVEKFRRDPPADLAPGPARKSRCWRYRCRPTRPWSASTPPLLAATGRPAAAAARGWPSWSRSRCGLFRMIGVRVLVIDELHNLLAGSGDRRREFLNLLRFLGNELRIPLVGVGTREAYLAIRSDDQLENRFAPFTLPAVGSRRRGMLPAGQLRRLVPAAPALTDRHHGDGRLPADPQRGHDRRAGPPAHRGGRRRDRVRRGVDQPTHPATAGYAGPTERRRMFERELA